MRFRRRVGLAVLFAFAGALAVDAADPAKPGKLTPAQKEKLKDAAKAGEKLTPEQREKLIAKLKDLTPEQKQKLREKFKGRTPEKAAEPAKPTGPVVPPKPAPPKAVVRPVGDVVQAVDAEIAAKLSAEKVTASPRADDAEFLRRVSLDLTGVIPTADEARAFLDSTDSDKRAKLIDRLLESPRFGQHQADIWTAKLLPRLSDNRFVERQPFTDWVAAEFNKNTPWDKFTTTLLTATGPADSNPAATFFQANRSADKLTDAVGTHFLGVQIACAQCHNHPYTDWKQTDYWGVAAFFEKVTARPPVNPKTALVKDAPKPGVTELAGRTRMKDFFPESAKQVPPKFLGDSAPALASSEPYRPALAEWLTSGRSPYFAQAFVNRAWAQLFSRGLVDPIDDLDPTHPATHPEAFAALSEQFRATGYDVKRVYRTIALTEAYQRSSKPTAGNESDKALYSHMAVKVLSPEQLFDSLAAVVPMPGQTGPAKATGAAKANGGIIPRAAQQRDQFVQFFLAGADMANAAEYEAGIPQALRLMNSKLLGNPKAAQQFVGSTARETLETMYLATLSRRPTDAEVARVTAYHAENGPTATADVLWALINSSEFALVR